MSSERQPSSLFGALLGNYRVDAVLGAGGMGEVFRAHDTRLGRDVAIKILPRVFARDPDRVSRLEREARVLAALNHPNIGGIHGIEETAVGRALVLELVEGETLAERLAGGPLPVTEACHVARQIAVAVEAAHDKGIVHRDLKPANIKITPDGVVKVLDFGLAKPMGVDSGLDDSALTAMAATATTAGAIVGTVSYMSPEQARGRTVDKRTDIWAFGCVLYEMLSGRRPFAGEGAVETLAAILEREPDWSGLPRETPDTLRRLLHRCLEKDPKQRLRDIGEARLELTQLVTSGAAQPAGVVRPRTWRDLRSIWRWAAAATVVVLLGAVGFLARRQTPSSPVGSDPPLQLTDFTDSVVMPSLSHDGRMLTFIRGAYFGLTAPTGGRVYVKLLPAGEPVELTMGEGGGYPTFSPDDSRIVYTKVTKGSWDSWEVPVLGGAPQPFLPNASGLTWLEDRTLVYSSMKSGMHMGIVASTPSRNESREIYFPANVGGMAHRSAPSPDNRSLLVVEMIRGVWQPCRLVPVDGSSQGRPVGPPRGQCTSAAWSPDGRWMYFSSNAGGAFHIWRQRYPDGTPDQITFGPMQQEGTALTPDGRFLITSMGLERASVRLHDNAGERELTEEGYVTWPSMDPSGTRLYYLMRTQTSQGQNSGELWSMDLKSRRRQRLFPELLMAHYALSRDGQRVVFTTSGNKGGDGVWIADLDRRTAPRQLTVNGEPRAFFGPPGEIVFMGDDGRLRRMREDGSAVAIVSPDPIVYLMTASPDGRWAAVIAPSPGEGGATRVEFRSLRDEATIVVCEEACRGIGPASVRYALPFSWSLDGTRMLVNLELFAGESPRAVILPYRTAERFATQWPSGLKRAEDVLTNPGAQVIEKSGVFFAADPKAFLTWEPSFQSNLYRIRLPD